MESLKFLVESPKTVSVVDSVVFIFNLSLGATVQMETPYKPYKGTNMKPRHIAMAAQRGFSLLTGFILAITMFGAMAFFLAGQGVNSGFGSTYSNTAKVASLLTSAGYVSTGFDSVILAGNAATAVTFDTGAAGVFNPTSGGSSPQPLDPSLFARANTIDGYWVYRGNDITMKGVGVAGTADYTILVSGLKQAICQQINNSLHGTALNVNPTSLGVADAAVVGGPTAAAPSIAAVTTNSVLFDLSAVAGATTGWTSGCYATTTAVGTGVNYVYIHTLLAQ